MTDLLWDASVRMAFLLQRLRDKHANDPLTDHEMQNICAAHDLWMAAVKTTSEPLTPAPSCSGVENGESE